MNVFLSYSKKDFFFAELMEIKLEEAGIKVWRDKGSLVAGTDWQQGIERGISNCTAVLIALSDNSSGSAYVTYEWAYAIGKGKTVIPLKIGPCNFHPRLESIQYLDFSSSNSLPWDLLIERIEEIEVDADLSSFDAKSFIAKPTNTDNVHVKSILNYLNQHGFQMASFERIREKIDKKLSDERLVALIQNNKSTFRKAKLKGNKNGLAKIIP